MQCAKALLIGVGGGLFGVVGVAGVPEPANYIVKLELETQCQIE